MPRNDVVFSTSPNNDLVNGFTNPFVGTIDGSLTPANVLSNPFPDGLIPAPGRSQDVGALFAGQTITGPITSDPYSSVQQWNFSVQGEAPAGVVVEAAYAGSKGTHLPAYTQQINQLPVEFMSLGADLQTQVPNPFLGQITTGPLAAQTVARGQLLRPFPQYTGVNIAAPANRNSIYHSLQMKSEKRFSQGGSVLLAYTWAKLISDTDTLTGWLEPGGGFSAQNNYNLRLERALANYDVRHRLVLSYVVDLPFGRGQRFASGASGGAGKLVSGWGLNGVTTFQTGFPLGMSMAVNRTNSFGGGARPDSTGVSARLDGPAQSRLGGWFDTAQFVEPAAFTFGNVGRTVSGVTSHGINNFDFALFKNTELWAERLRLQFRAEIFNLFNRVQFGYPGRALGNPNFGVISGQFNNPRLVQFSLRAMF